MKFQNGCGPDAKKTIFQLDNIGKLISVSVDNSSIVGFTFTFNESSSDAFLNL
jgi:hypothetical protein